MSYTLSTVEKKLLRAERGSLLARDMLWSKRSICAGGGLDAVVYPNCGRCGSGNYVYGLTWVSFTRYGYSGDSVSTVNAVFRSADWMVGEEFDPKVIWGLRMFMRKYLYKVYGAWDNADPVPVGDGSFVMRGNIDGVCVEPKDVPLKPMVPGGPKRVFGMFQDMCRGGFPVISWPEWFMLSNIVRVSDGEGGGVCPLSLLQSVEVLGIDQVCCPPDKMEIQDTGVVLNALAVKGMVEGNGVAVRATDYGRRSLQEYAAQLGEPKRRAMVYSWDGGWAPAVEDARIAAWVKSEKAKQEAQMRGGK